MITPAAKGDLVAFTDWTAVGATVCVGQVTAVDRTGLVERARSRAGSGWRYSKVRSTRLVVSADKLGGRERVAEICRELAGRFYKKPEDARDDIAAARDRSLT